MWQYLTKETTSDTKWFFSTSVFSLRNLKQKIADVNFFVLNWYLQIVAYTHAKFERLEALLRGRERCLKADT